MKLSHFHKLKPVCPVCQGQGIDSPLAIGRVETENGDTILEGILTCAQAACLREFPIIDGIPIIVADIRSYISNNLQAITGREDLSPVTESMLGDATGPASSYDIQRQHLSSYCWDHYGDLDPEEPPTEFSPGAIVKALDDGLSVAKDIPPGAVVDVGCSVGRTSFELARRSGRMVIGIDLNFSMLRFASRVLRTGNVRYPRRRVGIVYDRRSFDVAFEDNHLVDFWACDATALPFPSESFSLAVGMNVLDCVGSPFQLLRSTSQVLKPNGRCLFSCPYDWSPAATPVENWLGGHSQRGPAKGESTRVVRQMFSQPEMGLRLDSAEDAPLWHVRLHERSTMTYRNHRVVATKVG